MTILAYYQGKEVEVQDIYRDGANMMVSIMAIEGTPFVGGDKWPVRTKYATVPAEEIELNDDALWLDNHAYDHVRT